MQRCVTKEVKAERVIYYKPGHAKKKTVLHSFKSNFLYKDISYNQGVQIQEAPKGGEEIEIILQ